MTSSVSFVSSVLKNLRDLCNLRTHHVAFDTHLLYATNASPAGVVYNANPAFNLYEYNTRSEVVSANRYWGDTLSNTNIPVLGQQHSYAYDPIGNRTQSGDGIPAVGSTYAANALNQYTSRTVPSTFSIIGNAPTNVNVYVNETLADRQETYWHSLVTVNNVPSSVYAEIEVLGVYTPDDPQAPEEYAETTNHVFVAQSPEIFTYGADGNMTSDGRFTYTWNGENRLICAETRSELPLNVPRHRIEYAYDHQGRMVSKEVFDVSKNYKLETKNYLWDGWNIIAENTITTNGNRVVYNVWGKDLSGNLQDAGGVGGLLAVMNEDGIFVPAVCANAAEIRRANIIRSTIAFFRPRSFPRPVVSPVAPIPDS